MRLVRRVVEWGLPPPERQVVVRDGQGRFVARADLGWPDRKTLLEYDGDRHHGPRQQPHDRARQARVEAAGWKVERARKDDLHRGETRLREVLTELFDVA
jgi:very-short-patch-repair endonuclease